MVVVSISLGGTPRLGVSIDGGASGVWDSHEVEGENAGRSRSRAIIGDAAGSVNIVKLFYKIVFIHEDFNIVWSITQNQCQSGPEPVRLQP